MKRAIVLILALLLAVSLIGCAKNNDAADPTADQKGPLATAAVTAEPTAEPTKVPAPENPVIRLSTTTSVNDSGLLSYLQPYFEQDTGYKLEITSAGTGAAIEKGKSGDADCLLVHAKASEEAFISEGYSSERIPFMYNFFVIVGPSADPAGVASSATAADAFKAIADKGATFISRGDDSGTHKAELKIWTAAGIEPVGQAWYESAGAGMGAVITMGAEQQAYLLTDKATYLSHDKKSELSILLEESEDMKNTYSMLAISPEKWPDTNIEGANAFIEWMTSDKATQLIKEYGVIEFGEALFFVIED